MKDQLQAPLPEPGPDVRNRPPGYFTKRQLSQLLCVSVRTVDELMRQRKLPFIRLSPRLVRFPIADVEDYLNRNLRVNARGE